MNVGKMPLGSKKGFSLIELLVVFSLMTIVSGVGFAAFSSYSTRQIVVQSAGNLKEVIDEARFSALSSVRPTVCAADDALSSYSVIFCNNALCSTNGASYELTVLCGGQAHVIKSQVLPDNVSFSNVSGSPTCGTLTFNFLSGIVTGTPCDISIDGYGNQSIVSVNSTGHVSY